MKKKFAYFFFSLLGLQSSGQTCKEPAGLLSAYFTGTTNKGWGLGIEAGLIDEVFPLGMFLGCSYIVNKGNKGNSGSGQLQNELPVFYMKAVGRLLRIENKLSAFIVASPQLGFQSSFNFQSGVKLFAPLSERVAIELETLYSLKEKYGYFNIHLAFVL